MSYKQIRHCMKECRKFTELAIGYLEKNEFLLAANQMSWQLDPDKGALRALLEMRAMLEKLEGYNNELKYLHGALTELRKKELKGQPIEDRDKDHLKKRLKALKLTADEFIPGLLG